MMMKIATAMSVVALLIFAIMIMLLSFGNSSKRMRIGVYEVNTDRFFIILSTLGGIVCSILMWVHWRLGGLTLARPELGRLYICGSWGLIISCATIYGGIMFDISKAIRHFEHARIQGGSPDGSRYRGNGGRKKGVFHQIYRGLRHWWKHHKK